MNMCTLTIQTINLRFTCEPNIANLFVINIYFRVKLYLQITSSIT